MKTTIKCFILGLGLVGALAEAAYVDVNQAPAAGKVNFYECSTTFNQRLNMAFGVAERSEVFNAAIKNKKCTFVTDLKNSTVVAQLEEKDLIFSINRFTIREDFVNTSTLRDWFSCDYEDEKCMNEADGINKYEASAFRDDSATGIKLNQLQIKSIKAKIGKNKNNQPISVYFFKDEVGYKSYKNDTYQNEFWYDLEDTAIKIN